MRLQKGADVNGFKADLLASLEEDDMPGTVFGRLYESIHTRGTMEVCNIEEEADADDNGYECKIGEDGFPFIFRGDDLEGV